MMIPTTESRPPRADPPAHPTDPALPPASAPSSPPLSPELEARLALLEEPVPWTPRAGRRNLREKLIAGLIGLKHAIRGDSSFFAHAYRSILVVLIAGMLGVDPRGWCLLALGLGLVLVAELAHSAVDTLARAVGDPDEPPLKVAREIAAAGVLVAVVVSASVSVSVIALKLGELLGWWA